MAMSQCRLRYWRWRRFCKPTKGCPTRTLSVAADARDRTSYQQQHAKEEAPEWGTAMLAERAATAGRWGNGLPSVAARINAEQCGLFLPGCGAGVFYTIEWSLDLVKAQLGDKMGAAIAGDTHGKTIGKVIGCGVDEAVAFAERA